MDSRQVLDQWLSNASKINGRENYTQTLDIVIGKDETSRIKTKYISIHPPRSLGDIAADEYGDKKFWKLIGVANIGPHYKPLEHMLELTRVFKERELSLVQTPANYSGGVDTIGELSLKYYGDKALWPLIVWTNPAELSEIKSADDKPYKIKTIFVIHFIP